MCEFCNFQQDLPEWLDHSMVQCRSNEKETADFCNRVFSVFYALKQKGFTKIAFGFGEREIGPNGCCCLIPFVYVKGKFFKHQVEVQFFDSNAIFLMSSCATKGLTPFAGICEDDIKGYSMYIDDVIDTNWEKSASILIESAINEASLSRFDDQSLQKLQKKLLRDELQGDSDD